jgi:hypothetical protein
MQPENRGPEPSWELGAGGGERGAGAGAGANGEGEAAAQPSACTLHKGAKPALTPPPDPRPKTQGQQARGGIRLAGALVSCFYILHHAALLCFRSAK